MVNVKNEGHLENATLELVSTNFKFKNIPEATEVKLSDVMQAGEGTEPIAIPVVAKNYDEFDLSLLNMQSQIKLKGKYIDSNENETDIDTTKAVRIEWTANELTEDDISLNQEVITNKIYKIGGEDRRVVQLLIKSKIQDNKAPVESSIIEISNPQIGGTTLTPVDVKVASYGTKATNGKTLYTSTSENGTTTISVLNNAEENIVSWKKNVEDIFVVTYICNYSEEENVELSTFVSNVKNTINVYGRDTAIEGKTSELQLDSVQENGSILNLETSIKEDIYKGKMYIGEDTTYQEEAIIYVPYKEVATTITVEDKQDVALSLVQEGEESTTVDGVSTYYKTTKINKEDAKKVLGENGTITIYNVEDKTTPIETINLAEETTEENYYTVSYNEGINKISIKMSKETQEGTGEGTIEIINEKAISVSNTDVASNAAQLKTNKKLIVTDNAEIVNLNVANITNLKEPKTTFDISFDKTSLSSVSDENELKIVAELIAKDESNKLFKGTTENPIKMNIELPKEVTEISIENISDVVGSDELTVKSSAVTTNQDNGNKVITIELQGEQTEYSVNNATIEIDTKVKTDKFVADKKLEIKATCINGAETVKNKETIQLISVPGLITKNTLTVGTNTVEKINENVEATITENADLSITSAIINNFNNFENKISNIDIVGNIPQGVTLKGALTSTTEGVKISYSEDLNTWTTEVTDYSNIKAFKISLDEMAKGSTIDLKYDLNVNLDSIQENTTITSNLNVNFNINGQAKQKVITFNLNVNKDEEVILGEKGPILLTAPVTNQEDKMIEITQKTTTTGLHQGQIVTYQIKVTNNTEETLKNAILEYTVPERAVLTELTYAQGSKIEFTEDFTDDKTVIKDENVTKKSWELEELKVGESITREVTLRITGDENSKIENEAKLIAGDKEYTAKDEVTIENNDDISVILSRRANMNIDLTEGNQIEYVILVTNNTNSVMNNLTITSQVPKLTSWAEDIEYNESWEYNETTKAVSYSNLTLESGETKDIRFVVKVENIGNESSKATIENTAVVTTTSGEIYETNMYTSNVLVPRFDIHMKTEHNEELNEGDTVKYIITVENIGARAASVDVSMLPDGIVFEKLTYDINNDNETVEEGIGEEIEVYENLNPEDILTIIIEGVTRNLDDDVKEKEISNVAKIDLGNGEYLESETITNKIINDNKGEPEDNEDQQKPQKPQDEQNPQKPDGSDVSDEESAYSISGLAWLDKNKDGIRDNQEKFIPLEKVKLLDKNGNKINETITSITGEYKFDNLSKGEYVVAFEYDTNKYTTTKYQVDNASDQTNSDVITKQINIDNKNIVAGITDIIKIENENITNLDIGLIDNPEFDLSLDKYISKVVVTNSEGTTTYEYSSTQLAKVEIGAKQLEGTTLLVEYEITVSNDGDVNGYVTDIIDYLPKQLEFNSEMNTEWYLGTDNYLHYMPLDPQAIEPEKTQTVKLVLTKTLKSDTTGTIENIAEISESANLESIKEKDSTVANKADGEDDISKASLIVSIKTGGPIMYIAIVISSMFVLGMGIYIINKKVLKVRI